MPMRILVVEDDKIINMNLTKLLSINGYAVDSSLTKEDALYKIECSKYDLILLDLSLPDGSGLDILKKFREGNTFSGVIIVSARDNKKIIKDALELGADDYMVKPIDLGELIGRVKAVMRRITVPQKGIIEIGKISINRDKMIVEEKIEDFWSVIDMTKKEFSILEYLAINRGKVVSQEEIIEHVWDESADLFSSAIRTHIKNLRKKTGSLIITVKGSGYVIK